MMKSLIFVMILFSFFSCSDHKGHDHDHDHDHDEKSSDSHEGHKHGDDDHSHDHDEKNDDSHEGHKHDDDDDEHGHDHGGAEKMGENSAIKSVGENGEIEFSEEALAKLNIKLKALTTKEAHVDKNALVYDREEVGYYLFRNGKFIFKKLSSFEKDNKNKVKFLIDDFKYGDQLAISEIGLIKISDIFAHDESEYGHSH